MATPQNNNREENNERTFNSGRGEKASSVPNDLPESESDRSHLQPEETVINLPDVKDIPGQEFVHVPRMESFADTTIASDDEEGTRVFEEDDDEDLDLRTGTEGDVSREERQTLADANYMPTRDEDNLRRASMDSTDFDGEALNEGSFGTRQTETDLDIPGASDEKAITGNGDEENKGYSLGSGDNDNVVEGTP